MSVWQFADAHPVAAFFMLVWSGYTIFCIYRCTMRHLNIRRAGWPPEHCDADGGFRKCEDGQ